MAKKITINSCVFRTVKYPGSEGPCNWIALQAVTSDDSSADNTSTDQAVWDEIIKNELFDPDAISLAHKLKANGCIAPSATGYELDGEVVAELVWEERKLAIQIPDQYCFRSTLSDAGWTVLPYDTIDITTAIKEA